jgi:tripartite-type tricarboxylate transporter receptor subunit TctC
MAIDRRAVLSMIAATGAAGCTLAWPWGLEDALAQAAESTKLVARLIVPGPGGTRTGLTGRILAAALGRQLGGAVDIVNTETPEQGYEAISQAPADGTTYGLVAADISVLRWREITQLAPDSFTALAGVSEDPAGMHVRKDAPWASPHQLAEAAKASPGKHNVTSAGRANIWQTATVRWAQASGLSEAAMPWLAAPDIASAAEDLAIGKADLVVCSIPEIRGTPQARAIKTIAVMSPTRHGRYPEVPAAREGGANVHAGFWRGVVAPKATQPSVAARMTATLKRAYDDPALAKEMHRRGFARTWRDGGAFAAFMSREHAAMGKALKAIGAA